MSSKASPQIRPRESKSCFLPTCPNNDFDTPGLRFFLIRKELKNSWCQLVNRNCPKRSLYCCEDHLNPEEDIENYDQYLAGGCPKLSLNAAPKNIPKNKRGRRRHCDIHEPKKRFIEIRVSPSSLSSPGTETCPSKPLQGSRNKILVPAVQLKRKILVMSTEENGSIASYTLSPAGSSSPTTADYSQKKNVNEKNINLSSTTSKIMEDPMLYIGIPEEFYFLVDILSKHTHVSIENVLLCLVKIRLNRTFSELAHDFDTSLSQASVTFLNNMLAIASVLSLFIKTYNKCTVKKNLPIALRSEYYAVNYVIDCLEIEIQEPEKVFDQSLTRSKSKNASTCKYLIAYTPDGLVNFVSVGYCGGISNVKLLEDSKFLDSIEPRSCILADSDFEGIESYLQQKDFCLLRPQNLVTAYKCINREAKQSAEIANARKYIANIIQRIREFSMLRPRSVVNLNLISVLDLCVITACALINLQDGFIK